MRRLSALRKKYRISQFELAERLNLSQQTISKYERGLIEPDFSTLTILSNMFKVSVDYLLEISDEAMTDIGKYIPDPLYMELAQEAQQMHLSESDVGYIINFIKHYKENDQK